MPDGAKITITGDDNLRRSLDTAQADLENLDQSDNARLVQQRAAANAPKVSGRLAGSLVAKDLGKGVAVVQSELVYAPVIHYGWARRNISPQPFLVSALDDSAELVEAATLRETNRILSHVRGA